MEPKSGPPRPQFALRPCKRQIFPLWEAFGIKIGRWRRKIGRKLAPNAVWSRWRRFFRLEPRFPATRARFSGFGAVQNDPAPFAVAVAEDFAGTVGYEGVRDRVALEFTDPGQDEAFFRRPPEGRGGLDQDMGQYVRANDIRRAFQPAGFQDIAEIEPYPPLVQAVQRGVFDAFFDANGVEIEGFDGFYPQFGRRDGQNAAAGGRVEHGAWFEIRAGPFEFFQAKPGGEMAPRPETEPRIDPDVDPLPIRRFFPDGHRPQAATDVLDMEMVPPKGGPLLLPADHGLDRGKGEVPGQFPTMDLGFGQGIEIDFHHGLVAMGLLERDGFYPPVLPDPVAKGIRIIVCYNEFQLTAGFHWLSVIPPTGFRIQGQRSPILILGFDNDGCWDILPCQFPGLVYRFTYETMKRDVAIRNGLILAAALLLPMGVPAISPRNPAPAIPRPTSAQATASLDAEQKSA